MQARIGDVVGSYEIVGLLGQGGMATVYKAYHAKLHRNVALKMIHAGLAEDPQFVLRFEREAQIIAALDHPHIVPIYDYAEHEGQPYLVMKFIEGKTLKQHTANSLTFENMLSLMQPIGDALDYAHRQGVLHRDVKPSNILLDEQTTPYLTDFGLAKLFENADSTISQSMLIGTPAYMSPEQAQGNVPVDHRSDLYSFGVVLYELVVGQLPFSSGTPHVVVHDQIYRPLPPPSELNPEVPKSVEVVLLRALDKSPEKRYSSASELVQALRVGYTESVPLTIHEAQSVRASDCGSEGRGSSEAPTPIVEAPLLPTHSVTPKTKKSRRWIAFGCAAIILLLAIFALAFLRQVRDLRVQRTAESATQAAAQADPEALLVYDVPLIALDEARANLRTNQQDAQAYLAVARGQYAEGDTAGALETLTDGIDVAGEDVRYLTTTVDMALENGDINAAYLFSGEVLARAEGTAMAQDVRAWVGEALYGAASRESPNLILLRRAITARGIEIPTLLEALAANSLLTHNRLPAAIIAIDTALATNPTLAESLLINGEVKAALGDMDAARQSWQIAQDQRDAPDWVRTRIRTLLASNTT